MNDEFQKVVIDPLLQQEKEIGDDIKNYRLCPICLEYVSRDEYVSHTKKVHGYDIIDITESK